MTRRYTGVVFRKRAAGKSRSWGDVNDLTTTNLVDDAYPGLGAFVEADYTEPESELIPVDTTNGTSITAALNKVCSLIR